MTVSSARRHFVGFHVTEDVKRQLKSEAADHGLSVSAYVYLIVCRAIGQVDRVVLEVAGQEPQEVYRK